MNAQIGHTNQQLLAQVIQQQQQYYQYSKQNINVQYQGVNGEDLGQYRGQQQPAGIPGNQPQPPAQQILPVEQANETSNLAATQSNVQSIQPIPNNIMQPQSNQVQTQVPGQNQGQNQAPNAMMNGYQMQNQAGYGQPGQGQPGGNMGQYQGQQQQAGVPGNQPQPPAQQIKQANETYNLPATQSNFQSIQPVPNNIMQPQSNQVQSQVPGLNQGQNQGPNVMMNGYQMQNQPGYGQPGQVNQLGQLQGQTFADQNMTGGLPMTRQQLLDQLLNHTS